MHKEKLKDIAEITMGTSPSGDTYNEDENGLPLLNGPTEFGQISPNCTLFTTDSKRECKSGDLIFCVRGSTTGRMNWADQVYSLGRGVCSIRGNSKLETKYIKYALDYSLRSLLKLAGGGTFPNLTKSTIHNFEIPYSDSRFKIASILTAYDDLIENNTRRIEILEEMAQRIYCEWFVHFRYPGHENDELVDSGTKLGEIPKGWEVKKIGEICDLMYSGGTPLRREDKFWENGTIKWYKTKELHDNFLFESEEKINELALEDSSAKEFPKNTILMAIYGSPTVGRLGITTERSSCNQAALGMIADKEYCSQIYLYYVLYNLREYFNTISQGAAQQNISKTIVNKTDFLLAPKGVIDKFDELVEPIFQLKKKLTRKNIQLKETRDLLLPKLISGKIDVESMAITN